MTKHSQRDRAKVFCFTSIFMLLLTACATTQPARFYTLHVTPSEVSAATTGASQARVHVGIGPLSLPKYLDRLQIVTRDSQNQLQLAEFDQWAEPLNDAMIREITQGLSKAHPQLSLYPYPWNAFGAMDYRMVITVLQFDGILGDTLDAEMRWVLINERTNIVVSEGYKKHKEAISGTGYTSLTAAMSAALTAMVTDMAANLSSIKAPVPSPALEAEKAQ